LDAVKNPIFLHDKEFRILRCNLAYQKCAGIPFKQIIGQPYYDVFPKIHAPLRQSLGSIENSAVADEEEVRVGEIIYRSRSYIVKDHQGSYLCSLLTLEDITARRQAEVRLRLFRTLLDHSSDSIEVVDPVTFRFVDINKAGCADLGYSYDEFLSLTIPDISPTFSLEKHKTLVQQIRQSGKARFEGVHRRKDGSTFPVEISATFIKLDKLYMLSIVRDITLRKKAEEVQEQLFLEVNRNASEVEAILNTQQDIILEYDKEMNVRRSNLAFLKGYGFDPAGVNIKDIIRRVSGRNLDGSPLILDELPTPRALNGEKVDNMPFAVIRADGTTALIEISSRPLDISGSILGSVTVWHDITERKKAEVVIQNTTRALATLSEVNHSLVHATDENQLLQAVCQAIVKQRGYRMAWVGYLEQDEAKTICPVAHDGFEEGYLEQAHTTWADTERGRGPVGRAARSGQTQVVQNFQTDESALPWRVEAAKRGYASNIALPLINEGTVFGVLTIYSGYADAFGQEEVKLLEQMAVDLAFGVRSLHTRHERDLAQIQIQTHLAKLEGNLEDTIKAIAAMVEMRDPYTAGHEKRVAELAVVIARQMGLPEEQVHGIHLAGEVHDLGKIQIPAEILSKPSRLTEIEYRLIKAHPQAGYDILKGIDFTWPIAQMVLQHHERIDGSGYPQGLKGDAILLEARILCVADVVEAMSSHRPYRPALGIEAALNEIERGKGTLYDPAVADACLKVFAEGKFKF
ncbi:MAG TPA: HD domain-containing phosphohydrolase, partial [Gallionellaceae bacterium]|nr:HD domain-containing phosphohydrolase [Gallionellaceae bacterium]